MSASKLDRIRVASTAALAVLAGAAANASAAKRVSEEEVPPCVLATFEREADGSMFHVERAIHGESIIYIAGVAGGRVTSITVAQDGTLLARVLSE